MVSKQRTGVALSVGTVVLAGLLSACGEPLEDDANTFAAAVATAPLTTFHGVDPGEVELPIGISSAIIEAGIDELTIRLNPTNSDDGCVGWHTYYESPANAATLRSQIAGMLDGSFVSPELLAGDYLEFIGGNVTSALPDLRTLFEARKDEDGLWRTIVVVYRSYDCSNPNGALSIIGFVRVAVESIATASEGAHIELRVLGLAN